MSFQKEHVDITDHVTGRFKESGMVLYHQNEEIGTMISEKQYELKSGYSYDQNRFYRLTDTLTHGTEKYVDCDDENGWC
ncbi:YusG family protein [Bacillus altitudinis]|uniref:YusG family protein n=1 Tax=Bacillus pumilus TaxID=1408 RepID=UPI00259FE1DD|nr:YusG family protein [Bacillus pumilus]MDM5321396.1 YusG family protein [Bacillus pumilus]MDR4995157.1 YusG family protein [Bacillus altitudinis]